MYTLGIDFVSVCFLIKYVNVIWWWYIYGLFPKSDDVKTRKTSMIYPKFHQISQSGIRKSLGIRTMKRENQFAPGYKNKSSVC